MGRRGFAAIVGAIVTGALIGSAGASAATEAGSRCGANAVFPIGFSATTLQFHKSSTDPLPIKAPMDGVLTEWKLNLTLKTAEQFPVAIKVLRGPNDELQVAADAAGTISHGQNVFATQIPIQAGDRFGLFAKAGNSMPVCDTGNKDDYSVAGGGEAEVGTTLTIAPVFDEETQVPVTAVIEADADGDGLGDETQDPCPGSAAPCPPAAATAIPPVALDAETFARKGSVLALVSASSQASVTVSAAVKVRGRKGRRKLVLPALTKTVDPSARGRFTLKFPKALKSALAALSPGRSLTMSIRVSAPNSAGQISEIVKAVRLKR